MMAKLSRYLPPFAGDYSGACATLFEFDCLVAIIDAGCCTRNYVEYEESRWQDKRRGTFSVQLRTLDVALGNEVDMMQQILEAASKLHPSFIALVGTPVPALMGMDLEGIALEIEGQGGIPTIGIPTTGFDSYDVGIRKTLEQFCRRIEEDYVRADSSKDRDGTVSRLLHEANTPSILVNILGATPFDYGDMQSVRNFEIALRSCGVEILFTTTEPRTWLDLQQIRHVDFNLVLSEAALSAANYLEKRFEIPYLVGMPFSQKTFERALSRIHNKQSGVLWEPASEYDVDSKALDLLLVGDQVIMNSLRGEIRSLLEQNGIRPTIAVASFFSMEAAWMEANDFQIEEESVLEEYLVRQSKLLVVGDPLLSKIPSIGNDALFTLPQSSISSYLYRNDQRDLFMFEGPDLATQIIEYYKSSDYLACSN